MTTPTGPQPATPRPPSVAGWIFAAVQTMSGLGLALGLWALLGWELALVITSGVAFAGSVTLETLSRRPPRPPAAPASGGDR